MSGWIDVKDRMPKGANKNGELCENIWMLFDNGKMYPGWMNGLSGIAYRLDDHEDYIIREPISRVKMWHPAPEYPDCSPWISVENMVPEFGVPVVVLSENKSMLPDVAYRSERLSGAWCSRYCLRVDNVTHWMPLPKPPDGSRL